MHDKTTVTHWDGHQMYIQGYSVHTHTSHTDFSTDLSWDGQSRPNPVAAVETLAEYLEGIRHGTLVSDLRGTWSHSGGLGESVGRDTDMH